jgi:uncharacterized membrane protein YdjX (TVP38/TMEM64 family)
MLGRFWEAARRHRGLVRAGLFILLLLAVALALRFLPLQAAIEWIHAQAESLGAWAPIVFVLAFVALTVVLLPGAPLNVAAGVIFGPLLGGVVTAIASNAAAAVSFGIGRGLAHRRAARLIERYPKLKAVYRTLKSREGWKLVAAVRLSHALPFGLQNFLLGASPVSFWAYLLTTIAVTLPGIFVIAYLGHLGAVALAPGETEQPSPWRWALRIGGLAVAAAAIYYIGRTVRRAIKERAHIDLDED